MDKDEIKEIVRESVHQTLIQLGLDVTEYKSIQADMIYLRKVRQGSEEVNKWMRRSMIGVIIPAILFLLWEAFKGSVTGK